MKKNLILLAACGGMLLAANESKAQESVVVVDETVITTTNVECKNHYTSSWRDNWFIQLGAGAHSPFVESSRINSDSKTYITATYNLGFGHWFSPYFGFRFTGFYQANHWNGRDVFSKSKNANLNLELMWDLINSAHGVNNNRVFSLIPFIGVGGAFSWDYKGENGDVTHRNHIKRNVWSLPVSTGIQFRFRLCKYVDFFAEGRFMFYTDEWNREVVDKPIDIDAMAIGGFNINIGGREYASYNPCEYLDYINSLNGQVNDLRGALATTAAALAAAEAQLPCPEVAPAQPVCKAQATPLLSAVRFKINSAKVSKEEMVNVYNVAQWMKANPNVNVVIRGYADKDTGTSTYNMQLSERRAQSVYDILVNEYGIDKSRLQTQQFGSDEQPYPVNNWNRIVIFAE